MRILVAILVQLYLSWKGTIALLALLHWVSKLFGGKEKEMVLATTSIRAERKDLKTLPGAYVAIRRMNHGERMQRQELINKAKFMTKRGSRDINIEMDVINAAVALFEWALLITEHNLEYEPDPVRAPGELAPLNFKDPNHVRMVDGKASEEINTYIGEINNFDIDEVGATEDEGNSSGGSAQQ
jgi:hypothetical protein